MKTLLLEGNSIKNKYYRLIISSLLFSAIVALSAFNTLFFDIISMDKQLIITAGSDVDLPQTIISNNELTKLNMSSTGSMTVSAEHEDVLPDATNQTSNYDVTISFNGLPVKTINVTEVEPILVQASGQSIGILLQTEGVSIVGFSAIIKEDGSSVNPALDAGLKTEDFITTINGNKINNNEDIARIIYEEGQNNDQCEIVYLRNNIRNSVLVEPLFCTDSESWRIGLYVRDNTAGLGTLSFYEPQSNIYGALGHEVPDLKNGVSGEEKGTIVRAAIQGIKIGEKGTPGEKLGVFMNDDWSGEIHNNSTFGIYGVLNSEPEITFDDTLIPVPSISEIELGEAIIYTVIEGESIEVFEIEIEKIMEGHKLTGKGMVIEITDPDLLELTGGIIQGMSGSPIIQNGYFIGAVSHVFINDPTHGYACFSEWMLEDAGIIE